jgi:hypothetical protein
MRRRKIIGTYAVAGPFLGGLLVAAAMVIEDPQSTILMEKIALCFVVAFPLGGLAAVSAGAAHAALGKRLHPCMLVPVVSLVGLMGHIVTAFVLGNPASILRSWHFLFGFVAPPLISAAAISSFLLLRNSRTSASSSERTSDIPASVQATKAPSADERRSNNGDR